MNNNINENLKPKQEIVQTQNTVENQEFKELKKENNNLFNNIENFLLDECQKMKKNEMLKGLLEKIRDARKKIKEDEEKNISFLKDEKKILEEIDEILKFFKISICKIAEKYEYELERKNEVKGEYENYEKIKNLYEKLKDLLDFYDFKIRNIVDFNENLKPKQKIVQTQNAVENQELEELKNEELKNEELFNNFKNSISQNCLYTLKKMGKLEYLKEMKKLLISLKKQRNQNEKNKKYSSFSKGETEHLKEENEKLIKINEILSLLEGKTQFNEEDFKHVGILCEKINQLIDFYLKRNTFIRDEITRASMLNFNRIIKNAIHEKYPKYLNKIRQDDRYKKISYGNEDNEEDDECIEALSEIKKKCTSLIEKLPRVLGAFKEYYEIKKYDQKQISKPSFHASNYVDIEFYNLLNKFEEILCKLNMPGYLTNTCIYFLDKTIAQQNFSKKIEHIKESCVQRWDVKKNCLVSDYNELIIKAKMEYYAGLFKMCTSLIHELNNYSNSKLSENLESLVSEYIKSCTRSIEVDELEQLERKMEKNYENLEQLFNINEMSENLSNLYVSIKNLIENAKNENITLS